MAGRRLAEGEAISGATDRAKFVDGLKDRQEIEIKAAQIKHGAALLTVADRS
jgi:hypothetical protein